MAKVKVWKTFPGCWLFEIHPSAACWAAQIEPHGQLMACCNQSHLFIAGIILNSESLPRWMTCFLMFASLPFWGTATNRQTDKQTKLQTSKSCCGCEKGRRPFWAIEHCRSPLSLQLCRGHLASLVRWPPILLFDSTTKTPRHSGSNGIMVWTKIPNCKKTKMTKHAKTLVRDCQRCLFSVSLTYLGLSPTTRQWTRSVDKLPACWRTVSPSSA